MGRNDKWFEATAVCPDFVDIEVMARVAMVSFFWRIVQLAEGEKNPAAIVGHIQMMIGSSWEFPFCQRPRLHRFAWFFEYEDAARGTGEPANILLLHYAVVCGYAFHKSYGACMGEGIL